ncbi:phage immunity protein, partial [Enterococcus faecium]
MAKRVRGEDGKMYKVKKPFYKRVWFWVLAIIFIAIVGNGLSGGNNDSAAEKS